MQYDVAGTTDFSMHSMKKKKAIVCRFNYSPHFLNTRILSIPRMYFRIHHFRTHHVTDRSRKPWQHSPRQEARFLLQGHDEHTKKEKPNKIK